VKFKVAGAIYDFDAGATDVAVGDSVIGWSAPPAKGGQADRVAVAIADVRYVEVYRMNVAGTVATAFVGALGVATILLGVFIIVIINVLTKAW
jgi:hypothetical protein